MPFEFATSFHQEESLKLKPRLLAKWVVRTRQLKSVAMPDLQIKTKNELTLILS